MEEILLEKKLTTDFTMGFELEAIWTEDAEYNDDDYDSYSNYEDEINHLFDSEFPGGDLHGDGSVHGNGEGVGFEWASPVLPFNVATLQKIINFYRKHLGKEFIVNDSCGYHHHISFSGISVEDVVWIMCKLALDNRMRDLISNFEGIEFVSGWSNDNYLDDLADAVHNNNYGKIIEICNTDKYSLINVHSNKTLEWRGPRGFLNKEDPDIIIKFYKRLHQFITWITDVLDENEIEGISKDNFIEMIRAALPSKRIRDFYSNKSDRIKGEMKPETVDNFVKNVIDDNKTIFKLLNSPKPFEQVIQKLYNRNRLGGIVFRLNDAEDKNEGNLIILNNLCYKYIPYRMAIDFMDTLLPETLEKTSALTMERFMKTARKDGESVTNPMKYAVLDKIIDKGGANIIRPENAKSLYEAGNSDYHNSFNIIVKINENGWIDSIVNKQLAYNDNLQDAFEGNDDAKIAKMIEIFAVPHLVDDVKSQYTTNVLMNNISKYKEVIKYYSYVTDDIVKLAKEKGVLDGVLASLVKNGLITKQQETKYMAEMTSQSIDNINSLANGNNE